MKDLKEGYYIQIQGNFFQIIAREPFRYVTDSSTAEFTAVTTGSESGFQNIEKLEPDEGRLYQCFFGFADGLTYFFKIPTGTDRYGVDEDKDIGFLDSILSPYFAPNPDFEVFLVENIYPSINAKNESGVTVTPKVYAQGFKYDLREVTAEEEDELVGGKRNFTIVTVGGVAQ